MVEDIIDFFFTQIPGVFMGAIGLALLAMTFGSSPKPTDDQANWFQKYGTLVCAQRNADLHKLDLGKGKWYYLCQDKQTKVLSDFE